jgi:hypothetical protein
MEQLIQQRLQQVQTTAEKISMALRNEICAIGLSLKSIDPDIKRAEYSLSRDPASGKDSLIGIWRDTKGNKQGEILFHADGSFFAEYDVICNHPVKPKWFVEGVAAWGRDDNVKSELKLLPVVE